MSATKPGTESESSLTEASNQNANESLVELLAVYDDEYAMGNGIIHPRKLHNAVFEAKRMNRNALAVVEQALNVAWENHANVDKNGLLLWIPQKDPVLEAASEWLNEHPQGSATNAMQNLSDELRWAVLGILKAKKILKELGVRQARLCQRHGFPTQMVENLNVGRKGSDKLYDNVASALTYLLGDGYVFRENFSAPSEGDILRPVAWEKFDRFGAADMDEDHSSWNPQSANAPVLRGEIVGKLSRNSFGRAAIRSFDPENGALCSVDITVVRKDAVIIQDVRDPKTRKVKEVKVVKEAHEVQQGEDPLEIIVKVDGTIVSLPSVTEKRWNPQSRQTDVIQRPLSVEDVSAIRYPDNRHYNTLATMFPGLVRKFAPGATTVLVTARGTLRNKNKSTQVSLAAAVYNHGEKFPISVHYDNAEIIQDDINLLHTLYEGQEEVPRTEIVSDRPDPMGNWNRLIQQDLATKRDAAIIVSKYLYGYVPREFCILPSNPSTDQLMTLIKGCNEEVFLFNVSLLWDDASGSPIEDVMTQDFRRSAESLGHDVSDYGIDNGQIVRVTA